MDARAGSAELYYSLEKLVALHRNLIGILREEYGHMAVINLAGVGETARAKEAILSEVWSFEQLRIKCALNLAAALGLDATEVSLVKIAEQLPAAEGEKLRVLRTALNLLVGQAKELNTKNMAFAQSSLARIEEMKRNALGLNHTAKKENYSNSGVRQPIAEQGGRLLSTEA
ncbi:MAG: flagellar export chaperone FlgN [Deltaproteobacteria bacterium]|nr:flagellar export chaperone FlgN [Deltaproteobacteria bacterium]